MSNDVLGVGPQPQIVGPNLDDVADQLIAQQEERTNAELNVVLAHGACGLPPARPTV
jgi:hypothetical protein